MQIGAVMFFTTGSMQPAPLARAMEADPMPFLMAVKPSERTEMSAVYSSFRDVSGILTPKQLRNRSKPAPAAGRACQGETRLGWLGRRRGMGSRCRGRPL